MTRQRTDPAGDRRTVDFPLTTVAPAAIRPTRAVSVPTRAPVASWYSMRTVAVRAAVPRLLTV